MDGVEAWRGGGSKRPGAGGRLPIIALTANAMAGDEERYRAAGMDGFVAKPFEPDRLFAVLENWLGIATPPERRLQPDWLPHNGLY